MLKNEVLYMLERQKGGMVTGGQLADALKVSRTAVWKAVRALIKEGNEIVSVPNSGYRLLDTNDTLQEKIISENLKTNFVGRQIILLPTIHSTNRYLKEMGASEIANGCVVIANEQTEGRGRKDRTFFSPKNEGIYLSVFLKLEGLRDVRLLTICAAVAVSRAIEAVCGVRTGVKWVNDIYCGGKKICGILTEAVISAELQELSSIIVGIGINTGSVSPEISGIATSVQAETGMRGIRNRLAAEVLNELEAVYVGGEGKQNIIGYYRDRLFIVGRQVLVSGINHSYDATVVGIDETGALVVETGDGEVKTVSTGEIKLC